MFLIRFFVLYIWVILTMLVAYTFYMLVYLKWRIRIRQDKQDGVLHESENAKKLRAALRVLLYPLVFTLVWIPAMFNRLYEGWNTPLFALCLLQAMSEATFGLADTLVYLVTMRKSLWTLFIHGRRSKMLSIPMNDITLDHEALKDSKVN